MDRIKSDAPELIEMGGYHTALQDLEERLQDGSGRAVSLRLSRRICKKAGVPSPLALRGVDFNAAAESFYRGQLKKEQMEQALDGWSTEVRKLDGMHSWRKGHYNQALLSTLEGKDAVTFLDFIRRHLLSEELPSKVITRLIHLLLLTLSHMKGQNEICYENR